MESRSSLDQPVDDTLNDATPKRTIIGSICLAEIFTGFLTCSAQNDEFAWTAVVCTQFRHFQIETAECDFLRLRM